MTAENNTPQQGEDLVQTSFEQAISWPQCLKLETMAAAIDAGMIPNTVACFRL